VKVRRPVTDVLPLCHATNHHIRWCNKVAYIKQDSDGRQRRQFASARDRQIEQSLGAAAKDAAAVAVSSCRAFRIGRISILIVVGADAVRCNDVTSRDDDVTRRRPTAVTGRPLTSLTTTMSDVQRTTLRLNRRRRRHSLTTATTSRLPQHSGDYKVESGSRPRSASESRSDPDKDSDPALSLQ